MNNLSKIREALDEAAMVAEEQEFPVLWAQLNEALHLLTEIEREGKLRTEKEIRAIIVADETDFSIKIFGRPFMCKLYPEPDRLYEVIIREK